MYKLCPFETTILCILYAVTFELRVLIYAVSDKVFYYYIFRIMYTRHYPLGLNR